MNPLVSIIITTKNEENNVNNCLQSIKLQSYPENKIEIIVVDNNSHDKTKIIAKKFTQKIYNFGPERSAQRNFGVKKAQGKFIIYLDADMTLEPKLIEQAVIKIENSNFVALYLPEIILGNSYWNKVRNFERGFYNGTVIDAVRFIRKDAFIKSGGFDENLTGPEDWDLDKRIRQIGKVTVLNQDKAIIYHNESNFNLKNYLKKKNYYVKSFTIYIKKWGKDDLDIQKQFSPLYRYGIIFIEKKKWHKLIKHPILFMGMLFLRIAVGILYLRKIIERRFC